MITGKDVYEVLAAIVPLYVAMVLAYGSVRWWRIFTPDQCSGINRFVAVFAVPLLSFHFISSNNPYAMNYRFIAADSLQKVLILAALFLWQSLHRRSSPGGTSLEWSITLFSLSTLPNTLVMGIPLLRAMYGDFSATLMVQIVVLQSVVWYTLMLVLFEFRGATLLIADQFPDTAASIASFRVGSDVLSLNGREPLQADAEVGGDGKLHVVVRRSSAATSSGLSYKSNSHWNGSMMMMTTTPRASNLTGMEIYSVQSSREPTPRASSFNQADFYALFSNKTASPRHGGGDAYSAYSSKVATPRASSYEENKYQGKKKKNNVSRGGMSMSGELSNTGLIPSYSPPSVPAQDPPLTVGFGGSNSGGGKKGGGGGDSGVPRSNNKELHMFVWSSSASPVSEGNARHAAANRAGGGASADFDAVDSSKAVLQQEISASRGNNYGKMFL